MASPSTSTDGTSYEQVQDQLLRLASELTQVRRHLHAHPELSGVEYETTAYLSGRLTAEGIPHRLGPGGVGVVTEIFGAQKGRRVIALRADIDALPIPEESLEPYRSQAPGIMHACGHDAHTAMVLGTALALHRAQSPAVAWRAIFQSSEEAGQGALDLVNAGALEGVDAIVALHVDPNLPSGQIGLTAGPQTAFCQDFTLTIRGRGGHAARPHLAIDPIATAAQLINLIYQAVPRRTDSRKPLVVSICEISAGHCANVIPETALLRGTVRTLDAEVAKATRETLLRLCAAVAETFGASIEPLFERLVPGVVNDPLLTAGCLRAAEYVAGAGQVVTTGEPSLGAEDFADYLAVVPGCMMRLGVGGPGKKITPLHTPSFDLEESSLVIGARLLARTLYELEESSC